MDTSQDSPEVKLKPHRPFRRAVLRGLAILMPPLLTIALFIWAWSVVETSVLRPVESLTSDLIAVYTRLPVNKEPSGEKAVVDGELDCHHLRARDLRCDKRRRRGVRVQQGDRGPGCPYPLISKRITVGITAATAVEVHRSSLIDGLAAACVCRRRLVDRRIDSVVVNLDRKPVKRARVAACRVRNPHGPGAGR